MDQNSNENSFWSPGPQPLSSTLERQPVWLIMWLSCPKSSVHVTRVFFLLFSLKNSFFFPKKYHRIHSVLHFAFSHNIKSWKLFCNNRIFFKIFESTLKMSCVSVQFSCSVVSDSATPWTAACQASLTITNSRSLLKLIVHLVGDAIQPSHPLSSPSLPAFNLSQNQRLFKWVSSSHQVAKVLEFPLQLQSFQWIFRTDLL